MRKLALMIACAASMAGLAEDAEPAWCEIRPGFSFLRDGEEVRSDGVPATVAGEGEWVVQTRDFGGGLKVATKVRRFGPAVEWVNFLSNAGTTNTARISSFKDCDVTFPLVPDPVPESRAYIVTNVQTVIYSHKGSYWSEDEFSANVSSVDQSNRLRARLFQGETKRFAPVGGRSCDGTMPFFNLNRGNEGVLVAIGWTGQWNCEFSRSTNGIVRLRTGLEDSDFYLKPGESLRLSSIVLLPYSHGYAAGQNAFRRLVREHYSLIGTGRRPRQGPLSLTLWGGVTSEEMLRRVDFASRERLGFECVWVDAAWYGRYTKPCPNEFEGTWWFEAGDWRPNEKFHPDRMQSVADAVHRNGMKFLLWFEIERTRGKSPIAREHPEYFIWPDGREDGSGLIDYGNPAAWQWAYDTLVGHIETLGIDYFRQDFNMKPLAVWRFADAADGRKGLHEARHVVGMYRLWDALLERFPQLIIDNCASGGRRIDIETCRRSIPLWRSDYQCPANADPAVAQSHLRNISLWLPYHGTSSGRIVGDLYRWRSSYSPAMCCNRLFAMENRSEDCSPEEIAWLRKATDEYKRVRPYLSGDYWPLSPHATDQASWCAVEFFRPDLAEGVVLVFRRRESPFDRACYRLQGLEAEAAYELADVDAGTTWTAGGAELSGRGLSVQIPEQAMSKLFFIRKRSRFDIISPKTGK